MFKNIDWELVTTIWETFYPGFILVLTVIITGAVSLAKLDSRITAVEEANPKALVLKVHEKVGTLESKVVALGAKFEAKVEELSKNDDRLYDSMENLKDFLMNKNNGRHDGSEG